MNNPCEKIQDKIADYVLGLLNQEEIEVLHDVGKILASIVQDLKSSLKIKYFIG